MRQLSDTTRNQRRRERYANDPEYRKRNLAESKKWKQDTGYKSYKDPVRHAETYTNLKDQVLELLGRQCAHCGYDRDVRALQIDHINGDGAKERRKVSMGVTFLRHVLKKNGKGYQILCANCNQIKKFECKEYHGSRKSRTRKISRAIQPSDQLALVRHPSR